MDSIASRDVHVDCPAPFEQEKSSSGSGTVVGAFVVGVFVGSDEEEGAATGEMVGFGVIASVGDGVGGS